MRSLVFVTAIEKYLDRALGWAIIALIFLTPLAAGAVSTPAYTALEVTVFALVALWMLKLFFVGSWPGLRGVKKFLVPLAGFITLVSSQLIPLPARIVSQLSPATYQLYVRSMPAWPHATPYAYIARLSSSKQPSPLRTDPQWNHGETYRALSIAPSITRSGLLKLTAYICLFAIVLLYRFAGIEDAETGFCRRTLIAVIGSGLLLSLVGLATWSAGTGATGFAGSVRATGPYVNPDHFACYLSMVLPLAVGCVLFETFLTRERWSSLLRVCAGITAFAVLATLLLTQSRSGWISAVLGLSVVVILPTCLLRGDPSLGLRSNSGRIIGAIAVLAVILLFIGPRGRGSVDVRLRQTATTAGLSDRVQAWKDSLPMVRDFPLVGVGLGCWSEIYPRYESRPWSDDSYWGEPHNDYLQLLSETGFIGFGVTGCFFVLLVGALVCALRAASAGMVPVLTGLIAVVVAIALEEIFDFGLQVPANAALFTVLLALGLRIALRGRQEPSSGKKRAPKLWSIGVCAAMILLAATALPNLRPPRFTDPSTPLEVRARILSDPGNADGHLSLIELFGNSLTDAQFLQEVEIILWLEPNNPYIRDSYAKTLEQMGERRRGLAEIARSVLFSPKLSTHKYLGSLPSLSTDERRAVEFGFKAAVARGYDGAVGELSEFFLALGRPDKAAKNYDTAASQERDPVLKSSYLVGAGRAYVQAGNPDGAEQAFRKASLANPSEPQSYQDLIDVLVRKKDITSAKLSIETALHNGVDPFPLSMALARALQSTGDLASAESAVRSALANRPSDQEALRLLGTLDLQQSNFGEAAATFRRAAESDPTSAQDSFYLGLSEEAEYDYAGADSAFRRALALDPKNVGFKAHYHEFQTNLMKNRPEQIGREVGEQDFQAGHHQPTDDEAAEVPEEMP